MGTCKTDACQFIDGRFTVLSYCMQRFKTKMFSVLVIILFFTNLMTVVIFSGPVPLDENNDWTLVDMNYTWSKYYNFDTGQYRITNSIVPLNYKNDTGVFNKINCTFEMLDSSHLAYSYGYRVGNEKGLFNAYFKPNAQDNWPVCFAYNKSTNSTIHTLRSKLIGIGYLDPSNNNDYVVLQGVQSSVGSIDGYTGIYEDVFYGVDAKWTYVNHHLKEELICSNNTKTYLQNHPPSNYGLNNQNSYLVFVTKLDYTGLIPHNEDGEQSGNFTIDTGSIQFKNALGELAFSMPIGYFYPLYNDTFWTNLTDEHKMRYRLLQYNGEYYLLTGAKLTTLNQMQWPIVIDPTENCGHVGASADDADEQGSTNVITDTTLRIGDGGLMFDAYDAGFRWRNVDVAQGSTITDATFCAYYDHAASGKSPLRTEFYCHNVSNSWAFTTGNNNISGRTKTTDKVDFDKTSAESAGWHEIDITNIVDDVITYNGGWTANNALSVLWMDDDSVLRYATCRAWDFAGNAHGAFLNITYLLANTPPTHTTPIITPDPAYNSSNITCTNQSTADADGDTVTNIYNWFVDGNSTTILNMPFDTNYTDHSAADGIKDYSGNANHGTGGAGVGSATPTWNASGKSGGAYSFDGTDDYIEIDKSSSLNNTYDFSVDVWIKPKTLLGGRYIFSNYDGGNVGTGDFLFYQNIQTIGSYVGGGGIYVVSGNLINVADKWYHLAVVMDSGNTYKLYINGTLIDTDSSIVAGPYMQHTDDFWVGQMKATNYFYGLIDNLRVWNRTLSKEQISQLYLEGLNNYTNSTIVFNETNIGENWTCEVTPNDGRDDGTTRNDSIIITVPDVTSPEITINFAGNLTDSGGPYWRPPGESTQLSGTWSDGYYTTDSRQSEGWIYINSSIADSGGVANVWLQLLNGTTWTNWTYAFTNRSINGYWDINTSDFFATQEGYNYSFNIVANDTIGNSKTVWWNKTGLGGSYYRRHVQLNCTPITDMIYHPFYFFENTNWTGIYGVGDCNKKDRLHHDQGPTASVTDTGYLNSTVPDSNVELIYCTNHIGLWFDDSICVNPFTLTNIYFHFWWSSDTDELDYVGWYKDRDTVTFGGETDTYSTNSSNNRSAIYYDNEIAISDNYFLETRLFPVTSTTFTDNDIYEFFFKVREEFVELDNPSVLSNRSFTSFIFFNVPDNATLNASHADTDGDTLSDWTELYVTYTNPFLADTDNDGYNDNTENTSGSDPNNYTDIPDIISPEITINFAGNLSDSGGPYWRPPGESTQLTGTFSDGYYANESRQQEDWIYINLSVNDSGNVDEVWLHWLNETTWTNNSYQFVNTAGYYWEYNTSGNIQTCAGYNYSFDIWANDTNNNINISWWNKTVMFGDFGSNNIVRRFVQLNYTLPTNVSYTPYYFVNLTEVHNDGPDDQKKDRLHHDQGTDGTAFDIGYLKTLLPSTDVEERHCYSFVDYWFDESVCADSFTLKNIYFHFWWKADINDLSHVGWYKSREDVTASILTNHYATDTSNNRSTIMYNSSRYYLDANYLNTTNTNFTDNDIYELNIIIKKEWAQNPSVISNRSFTSFVLFNVPDNATLNASHADTDGDTLSDWTELYVTYTNPFLADTDNDGINDYWENRSGSDPNNYTDTFNCTLVFEINRTGFAFGIVQENTMVYSNASAGDTFKIFNNGTCSIDIDVNGTNATGSGVADWVLNPTNGDNLYKLEVYNSSTSWVQVNLTRDTWYSNMAQSTNITSNIRITTPTTFYSGKQMTFVVYMIASVH